MAEIPGSVEAVGSQVAPVQEADNAVAPLPAANLLKPSSVPSPRYRGEREGVRGPEALSAAQEALNEVDLGAQSGMSSTELHAQGHQLNDRITGTDSIPVGAGQHAVAGGMAGAAAGSTLQGVVEGDPNPSAHVEPAAPYVAPRSRAARFLSRLPWTTAGLLALNIAVFKMGVYGEDFGALLGWIPARLHYVLETGDPLQMGIALVTLVTSQWLHINEGHLFWNMAILAAFGIGLEHKVGHWRLLRLYMIAGLAGVFLHTISYWGSPLPTIGASGSIAGLIGAQLVLGWNSLEDRDGSSYSAILLAYAVYFFAIETSLMALQLAGFLETSVSHGAHVGGMIAGFLVMYGAFADLLGRLKGWIRTVAQRWAHGRDDRRSSLDLSPAIRYA